MKEDIFFKVGYSSYLQKEKNLKEKWTSKLFRKICEHKFLVAALAIILICAITNFCLMYRFLHILSRIH